MLDAKRSRGHRETWRKNREEEEEDTERERMPLNIPPDRNSPLERKLATERPGDLLWSHPV